jgi:hypothetical protein
VRHITCDRCGGGIDDSSSLEPTLVTVEVRNNVKSLPPTAPHADYDLCLDCANALERFINKPRPERAKAPAARGAK